MTFEISQARDLQKEGFTGPFLLQVEWVEGALLVYSNATSAALMFSREDADMLINNYKIKSIEFANNGRLVLVGDKIVLLNPTMELTCLGDSLLMGVNIDYRNLLLKIQKHVRDIFMLNGLVKSIIDENLLQCCHPLKCTNIPWSKSIVDCFSHWAEKDLRSKRSNELISYMIGDQTKIDSISNQLAQTLESYNSNFEKIGKYKVLVRNFLNKLVSMNKNITNFEKFFHQNAVISSILADRNA